MTTTDLKSKIKSKVDEINDVELLEEVNSIVNYLTSGKEDWNNLSTELKEAVEEGLQQLNTGNKISYDELKKRNSRWFTT
ncbi:MAG: hypothetical protein WBQ38_10615 [Ignavibacteria bacterium]|jgi:vacuolar-type H+-ATPase subunit I/STV1|nr:hypothetical protein [Ignavibacteria bacterium]MBK6773293.1 hypothetical protein [Ignavibacteria bacterium]MBK7158443.1 hypothetical protein [Ignavibacteria bacterium]MBK7254971.1 hypothetical protein [Ignavibacteria bacterium]MBK7444835.1 hypothetical protein [Ignavibacteria bacterium]